MRHLKAGRKFGRTTAHRKALLRNLVTSLMLHGRIRTTEAKAKELRRYAERIITLGKEIQPSDVQGPNATQAVKARRVHLIRRARRWVLHRDALNLVFGEYAERFKDRKGGYTRIFKVGPRHGDNAPMAIIELLGTVGPVVAVGENADETAADLSADAGGDSSAQDADTAQQG